MEFVSQALDQLTSENYFKVGISDRMFHVSLYPKKDRYFLITENDKRVNVVPRWAMDMTFSLIGKITYVELNNIILYESHIEGPNLPLIKLVLIEEDNTS